MGNLLSDFDFEVRETLALPLARRQELLELFRQNYREADPSFLDRSLATLRYLAMAYREGVAVGFALAEARIMDLPRLPAQTVILAGISCIAPAVRRRGLFSELERLAATANPTPDARRRLLCGRMAHPAAFRTLSHLPGAVPVAGKTPTPWQQQVGREIARAYGVRDFDPETFVCLGSGRPIGYPRIEFQLEPHEWKVFEPVDRDRGDALLGLAWHPDGPDDWTAVGELLQGPGVAD